jgi:hypothetical protein
VTLDRTLGIVRPLVVVAVVVGAARFALSVAHAPRALVYAASLTAVELGGMVWLAVKVAREPRLGYRDLWLANMILFGTCQLLTIAGLAYTYGTGTPTLYHETERLRAFLKYDPTPAEHIAMHVMNWMVIAPAIATWGIGAPIVYLVRRAHARRASSAGAPLG